MTGVQTCALPICIAFADNGAGQANQNLTQNNGNLPNMSSYIPEALPVIDYTQNLNRIFDVDTNSDPESILDVFIQYKKDKQDKKDISDIVKQGTVKSYKALKKDGLYLAKVKRKDIDKLWKNDKIKYTISPDTSVTIKWETNKPSTGSVKYKLNEQGNNYSSEILTPVDTKHEVTITGLTINVNFQDN